MKTLDPLKEEPHSKLTRRSPASNASELRLEMSFSTDNISFETLAKKHVAPDDSDMPDADYSQLQELIQQLNLLRSEMLELETSGLVGCAKVHPEHRASARNLMHYLALRRHDLRHLQSQLAALGLSSLGRTESHVMSALRAVVNLLARLTGSEEVPAQPLNDIPGLGDGDLFLEKNTEILLAWLPRDATSESW